MRKLAYGHLAYENDALPWDSTYNISMWLLSQMTASLKQTFFEPYTGNLLPEVGSRSLEHIMLNYGDDGVQSFSSCWMTVQENRYSYCVSPDSNKVKFIIANSLAVEVQIIGY